MFSRLLEDCTGTFIPSGLGHCSSALPQSSCCSQRPVLEQLSKTAAGKVLGALPLRILLRIPSVEPLSSCSPALMQGSNSLAPRFIKLRLFVTRCEPVLYNNFPKLLHAREITSHGSLNSRGKSRLHIRDEHLEWSRWMRQQRVRSCALQSLRKAGTGNCLLDHCVSVTQHLLTCCPSQVWLQRLFPAKMWPKAVLQQCWGR